MPVSHHRANGNRPILVRLAPSPPAEPMRVLPSSRTCRPLKGRRTAGGGERLRCTRL
jgi:hypothetical protein